MGNLYTFFQTLIVPSSDEDIIKLPSREYAREFRPLVCPVMV